MFHSIVLMNVSFLSPNTCETWLKFKWPGGVLSGALLNQINFASTLFATPLLNIVFFFFFFVEKLVDSSHIQFSRDPLLLIADNNPIVCLLNRTITKKQQHLQ